MEFIKYGRPIMNHDALPDYPIPKMDEVLDRFLEWVEPLVNRIDYLDAKIAVEHFLESGLSDVLENKIRQLGERPHNSWIFDYWVKMHLEIRNPLSPHTNVPILYKNPDLDGLSAIQKSAVIIYCTALIYKRFKEKGVGSYSIGRKKYSADQFHGLLASMNHISEKLDTYYINDDCSENVIFMYQNRFYNIPVIENGNVVSINRIYNTLLQITSTDKTVRAPNVNWVTVGVDRDDAARLLSEILKDDGNCEKYHQIKKAILFMNFDQHASTSIVEALDQASYHRTYVNRWHGKGLQFNCSENGELSLIIDHAYIDGGTEVYFVERLKEAIQALELRFDASERPMSYNELAFDLKTSQKAGLMAMKAAYDQCMDAFIARHIQWPDLKRSYLKNHGVLSGDGFIHLAFQAAQYATFGCIYNTYVSVDARRYFRGRTEVNRPVTNASKEFAIRLSKQDCEEGDLRDMMHTALNSHHHRVKLCQEGQGVNRYLYVLGKIFLEVYQKEGYERPALFDKEAFKRMASSRISTTGFSHPHLKGLYFPPVEAHGLGIFYWVGEASYGIITAEKEDEHQLDAFVNNLQKSIQQMLALMSNASCVIEHHKEEVR